jgi:protoheme IX farnesyltransferase
LIKKYYQLTKPGIVRGNLITAAAGFIFASKSNFDFNLFLALAVGISAIMASACVFNNYIDREIDAKMSRTKSRAFASGDISVGRAMAFGAVLGIFGFLTIGLLINLTTFILGLVAYVNYIVFYGIAKRKSIHGTLVGSISGALPLTAGYTAVINKIDVVTVTLFLIMVFWQMPHFYSIAIYRIKDYKAAKIPVLSIMKGMSATKISIVIYMLLFSIAVFYLYFAAGMSFVYLVVMSGAVIAWFNYAFKGFKIKNDKAWAGKMFSRSLSVLMTFSVLISIDNFIVQLF